MNLSSSLSPPRYIFLLGYGGLLPFIGLALLILTSLEHRPFWAVALVNYGAVILSFVGAFALGLWHVSAKHERRTAPRPADMERHPGAYRLAQHVIAGGSGLLAVDRRVCRALLA